MTSSDRAGVTRETLQAQARETHEAISAIVQEPVAGVNAAVVAHGLSGFAPCPVCALLEQAQLSALRAFVEAAVKASVDCPPCRAGREPKWQDRWWNHRPEEPWDGRGCPNGYLWSLLSSLDPRASKETR